jgi:hypothetical protein
VKQGICFSYFARSEAIVGKSSFQKWSRGFVFHISLDLKPSLVSQASRGEAGVLFFKILRYVDLRCSRRGWGQVWLQVREQSRIVWNPAIFLTPSLKLWSKYGELTFLDDFMPFYPPPPPFKNLCRIPSPPFLFARQVSNFAPKKTEVCAASQWKDAIRHTIIDYKLVPVPNFLIDPWTLMWWTIQYWSTW